jgi:large subunit ribosomal protein L9
MKVVFLTSVPPYSAGHVAEVAEGYAKNYLIPKSLAVPATARAVEEAKQRQQQHVAATASAEHDLHALAEALRGVHVHVEAKAAATGTLYAAVTPVRIAETLAKQTGYALPASIQKQLPTLKRVGHHQVTLQIHATTVTFTIDV